MSGRFAGRTVLITGAGRGQGRAHALAFAREGANVAVCDICEEIASAPYEMASADDLAETVRLCEAEDARVVSAEVDVRDYGAVERFTEQTLEAFGGIDILIANAGIFTYSPIATMPLEQFDETIDVNLRGVFHTVRAALPSMEGRGWGRVILIGSTASLVGTGNVGHYTAAKHAVLGLTKSLAVEQGPNGITANCICPTSVGTRMIRNDACYALLSPDDPTAEKAAQVLKEINAIPDAWVEPEEISELVLFLASDAAAHITGADLKVDMGYVAR